MPEMSLSTPTRTTLSEISADAAPPDMHASSASSTFIRFIRPSPFSSAFLVVPISSSGLPVRQTQHQPVQFGCHPDLAGQAAVRPALGGGAVEQGLLVFPRRRQPFDPGFIDIDVAGGAHRVAAAFGE